MTQLSQNTFFFDPHLPHSPKDPRLILVLPWMGAQDPHIAKYIAQHQALFPTSRILVVKFTMQLMFSGQGTREKILGPAVKVMRKFAREVEDEGGGGARLLVHIFSNGGVTTSVHLWHLLNYNVPRHISIFDSCPGYHTWKRTHHALALPLPRIFSPLVHIVLAIIWLLRAPGGHLPPQDINAAKLNSKARLSGEVRRTYLYGTGDEAVDWRDVERHAAEARTVLGDEGGRRVRLERFEGGRHVAHVRVDGERYWRVVGESWEGKGF